MLSASRGSSATASVCRQLHKHHTSKGTEDRIDSNSRDNQDQKRASSKRAEISPISRARTSNRIFRRSHKHKRDDSSNPRRKDKIHARTHQRMEGESDIYTQG